MAYDLVATLTNNSEVMRDEHVGGVRSGADIGKQVEGFGLDRDLEQTNGLVEDDGFLAPRQAPVRLPRSAQATLHRSRVTFDIDALGSAAQDDEIGLTRNVHSPLGNGRDGLG